MGTIKNGVHFNPVETLSEPGRKKNLPAGEMLPYIPVQLISAFAGVAAVHLMFGGSVFFATDMYEPGGGA